MIRYEQRRRWNRWPRRQQVWRQHEPLPAVYQGPLLVVGTIQMLRYMTGLP